MSHRASSPAPAARTSKRPPQFRSYGVASPWYAGVRHAVAALVDIWTEHWQAPEERLAEIRRSLDAAKAIVRWGENTTDGILRSLAECLEVSGC